MHHLRRTALRVGEKIRIERELYDELRLRAARELGVEHFVAEAAQPGRVLDAPQEVGAAVQIAAEERRLENDVVSRFHCRSGFLRKRCGAAIVSNLRHALPLRHECGEVFRFVRVSLVLDQDRRLVVLGTLQRRDEVDQPQRGDVLALEESDEIGRGEKRRAGAYLHACWPAPVRRTYGK
jgi:hypothetical protein